MSKELRYYVKSHGDRSVVIDRETYLRVAGPVEHEVAERRAEELNRHAEFKRTFGLKQK